MTCKCTCGGCDCPQFNMTYYPVAGTVAPTIGQWREVNFQAGQYQTFVIMDPAANAAAPCCPPLHPWPR